MTDSDSSAPESIAAQSPGVMAIVLAAGKGTRMQAELPKVLLPVLQRPLVAHVIHALESSGIDKLVMVVGYREALVRAEFVNHTNISFVTQHEQLGTGHAVKMCLTALQQHEGPVVIVTGDSPLLQADSVTALVKTFVDRKLSCLVGSLHHTQPAGLGRIVRDGEGNFQQIVEERDATGEQKKNSEVNMSTYVFDSSHLQWSLEKLQSHNAQNEFYLTDCPSILKQAGYAVDALPVLKPCESLSVNTPEQLELVEHEMRKLGY